MHFSIYSAAFVIFLQAIENLKNSLRESPLGTEKNYNFPVKCMTRSLQNGIKMYRGGLNEYSLPELMQGVFK